MMDNKIIIQSDPNDRSTDDVISWIKYLSCKEIITIFGNFKINDWEVEISNKSCRVKLNCKFNKLL